MPEASWPTEAAATKAVEAAARKAYEDGVAARRKVFPPGVVFRDWDDLTATEKLGIREEVLPVVWAALSALPDPRHEAWALGNAAGYREAALPLEEADTNPYPSGL